MQWPESSRIDPSIATDGKTGRWALARVGSYIIPIDPGHEGPRGPAWRRRGQRVCYQQGCRPTWGKGWGLERLDIIRDTCELGALRLLVVVLDRAHSLYYPLAPDSEAYFQASIIVRIQPFHTHTVLKRT